MKRVSFLGVCFVMTSLLLADVPAGYYYKANGKSGADLLDVLNVICSNGNFLSYGSGEGSTWEGFYYADRGADGRVLDMYSDKVRYQADFDAVDDMHIEHSLPKSWWGGSENYAYRDLYHLFPADGTTNMTKSNLPLGEVVVASFDNGVSKVGTTTLYNGTTKCFEPSDEYKGDFARAYFYVSTVYNELSALWVSPMMENETYPVWTDEALDLLLKWHREDPVSEKERRRQEAVYQLQHNRNPYVDYPEMVEHIWGDKMGLGISLPVEDKAFMTSPNIWTEIDIPVSYVGSTTSSVIRFEGANFSRNVRLEVANGSSNIVLSKSDITPREMVVGCDVTISVTSNRIETVVDTLVIYSEADTMRLGLSATFTDEFMVTRAEVVDGVSVDIAWTELPEAEEYVVTLRDATNSRTTDLMLVGYVEGSSYNKAISIYNGTGRDVDLKYYSLRKQSNGTGALKCDCALSGVLKNGECYVMVNSRANETLKAMADKIVSSSGNGDNILNFNGNDAIALYHNNVLIDAIGEFGNSADWGKDVSFERRLEVFRPNSEFAMGEWLEYKKDDFAHLEEHTVVFGGEATIENSYTTRSNSIRLGHLQPNTTYFVEVSGNGVSAVNLMCFSTSDAIVTLEDELDDGFSYYTSDSRFYIEGIESGCVIEVYDVRGRRICGAMGVDRCYETPILGRGLYIAKVVSNNLLSTIKFIIK